MLELLHQGELLNLRFLCLYNLIKERGSRALTESEENSNRTKCRKDGRGKHHVEHLCLVARLHRIVEDLSSSVGIKEDAWHQEADENSKVVHCSACHCRYIAFMLWKPVSGDLGRRVVQQRLAECH